MANHNDLIVWVDCEMTGLSLTKDALIEIAVVVTDSHLNLKDQQQLLQFVLKQLWEQLALSRHLLDI
jgi:oligoribonuclease (3'-5' exoribonuclease)